MRRGVNTLIGFIALALTIIPARGTAYCLPGITASGEAVRDGICAGCDEYYGHNLIVYQRLPNGDMGKYIGTYECIDKGGSDAIKKGYVIDIWQKDLKACQELMDLLYQDGCEGKIYIIVD